MKLHHICHSFVAGSMGGLSINLVHLPFNGTILDQPGKLMNAFEVITTSLYAEAKKQMERNK